MRKSPDIALRQCEMCGKQYKPTGNLQKYCLDCKIVVGRDRKRNWYRKKYPDSKPKQKSTEKCCICGSDFSCHFNGMPYCNGHYQSMKKYGQPYGNPRKSTNEFTLQGDVLKIATKKGDVFLADAEDYEILCGYSWCLSKTGYAVANNGAAVVKMHRVIMGIDEPNIVVDHKNGDTFDNRKSNLRICTMKENSKNQRGNSKSGLPVGVRKTKSGKYVVRIMVDRKQIHIGTFNTVEDAKSAREKAELKYCGDFAQHLYR